MEKKMKKSYLLSLTLLIVMPLIAACAPRTVPTQVAMPIPGITPGMPGETTKEAWEVEFEKIARAAKKEGKLVLYSGEGRMAIDPLAKRFEEIYGIKMEIILGRSPEIAARLKAERRGGLNLMDVYIGGASTGLTVLKPEGFFSPLEPALIVPDAKNPNIWWKGRLPLVDKDGYMLALRLSPSTVITINTSLVKPEEINSLRDLLNPRWKGKMVMTHPFDGAGRFWVAYAADALGIDYLRELAKQEPLLTRDVRLQGDWVAKGKYPIALGLRSEMGAELSRAGAPVREIVPREGIYISSGASNLALGNKPHNPNAARLFVNWMLTREAQTIFSFADGSESARNDVPSDHVSSNLRRDPRLKYFDTNDENFLLEREKWDKLSSEIFASLMR